ncbi:MAG: Na/Pi cotransporter family protein [Clostridia bacterium]|nr:Na/Pi cotransporter family protein [Clostridia bacterium]
MSLFDVFRMLGGLAFFIFGMGVMSQGLEECAGGKLEKAIRIMTESRLKGVLLGTAVTAAVQSSSAITVMLVGFVNSGIMQLNQCTGIIIGSNIGTTLTPWLLSFSSAQGSSFIFDLLSPASLAPLAALAGVVLLNVIKNEKIRNFGNALAGFAILIYGMELMSGAAAPLAKSERFANAVDLLSNPLLGLVAGTVITGIVQSSAATIGILQAISASGAIPYSTAIPIIMGQNIGTCVTAMLSGIGTDKNAKKVALIHTNFNIIGSLLFLAVYLILDLVFKFGFSSMNVTPAGIAAFHTVFNILSAIVLYPFSTQMEKLADIMIKEKHTPLKARAERKDKKYEKNSHGDRGSYSRSHDVNRLHQKRNNST